MPTVDNVIDFNSTTAYYVQLEQIILSRINSGEFQVGDTLPSEPELCRLYGVSRTVVRHALQNLEHSGRIYRVKGKGTFVSGRDVEEIFVQKRSSFSADMKKQGHTTKTRVISQKAVHANNRTASQLNIPMDSTIILIERVWEVDGIKAAYEITYLKEEHCSSILNADVSEGSIYSFLTKDCGLDIVSESQTVTVSKAQGIVSKYLEIPVETPVIIIESTSYLNNEIPVEFRRVFHRGDKSRLHVELIRTPSVDADEHTWKQSDYLALTGSEFIDTIS